MKRTIKILMIVIITAMLFGTFLAFSCAVHAHAQIETNIYKKTIGEITSIEIQNEICYIILDKNDIYAIDDVYEPNSTTVNFTKGDIVEITYKDTGVIDTILNIVQR